MLLSTRANRQWQDRSAALSARLLDVTAGTFLIGLVAVAFFPTLDNGFVNWDDPRNFLNNRHFRGLGLGPFVWAWTTTWLGVYQPLAWLTFETEYSLWELNPRGYHLTSVLFHAGNAVALYALIVMILTRVPIVLTRADQRTIRVAAVAAAALFAAHPLRVEPVAWVSCQGYLPCALLSMLSVMAYIRSRDAGTPASHVAWAASALLFATSLLAHATSLGVPVVLLMLDLVLLNQARTSADIRRTAWRLVPFFVIGALAVAIAWVAKEPTRSVLEIERGGVTRIVTNVLYAFWFYPYKTIVPLGLCVHYPDLGRLSLVNLNVLAPTLATALAVLVFAVTRGRPIGLVVAFASYAAILAPNVGLVEFGNQIVADRYSYLASIGPTVFLAALFARLGPVWRRWVVIGTLTLVVPLAVETRTLCRTWHDSVSLWSRAVKFGGDRNDVALVNHALAIAETPGGLNAAVAQLRRAARLYPQRAKVHYNLGRLLARQRRYDEAMAAQQRAIALEPRYALPRSEIGSILYHTGRYQEARAPLEEAIRFNPDSADAHRALALLLKKLGDRPAAEREFRQVVRLEPNAAWDHLDLALLMAADGRSLEAQQHLRLALRVRPDLTEARDALRRLQAQPVR